MANVQMSTNLKAEIREYLEKTGFKPYHLARAAGVSHPIIYSFLKGKSDINYASAVKIMKVIARFKEANQK